MQVQISLVEHAEAGYFCLEGASPCENLYCEEIDFEPMLMKEIIEKAHIFFNWLLTRVIAWQDNKQDGVDRVFKCGLVPLKAKQQ